MPCFTQNIASVILDRNLVTFSIETSEPIPLAMPTRILEFQYSIGRFRSETRWGLDENFPYLDGSLYTTVLEPSPFCQGTKVPSPQLSACLPHIRI